MSSAHELPQKPRVHITYDVETLGSPKKVELPFIVAVLSPLSGDRDRSELKPLAERRIFDVNKYNIDGVMKEMAPTLNFTVENLLDPSKGPDLGVDIKFEKMSDLSPDGLVQKIEALRVLAEKRKHLTSLLSKTTGKADEIKNLGKLMEDSIQASASVKESKDA